MFTTEGNLGDYCKTTAFDHKGNTIVMYWWLSHSFEFYMIYVLLGTSIFTCTYIQQWNVSLEAFICQSYSRWPCKVLWKLRSHRRICQPTPLRICSQNRMMVMMEVKTMMKHATKIWWISNEYLSDILCFGLGLKTRLLVGFFAIFQSVLTRRCSGIAQSSQCPNGHFYTSWGFMCNTSHYSNYSIWWVVIRDFAQNINKMSQSQ